MAYDVKEAEAYIRRAAKARGMDPDIAVRAAKSEGLGRGVWQSNVVHPTRGREPSYGPFQLLVGGENGWPTGLGNAFMKDTGLDPSDPANWRQTVDYGLDTVAREGWKQWYGPAKVGIGRWDGVRGASPKGITLTSSLRPGDTRAPIPVAPGAPAPDLVDRGTIGGTPVAAPPPESPSYADIGEAFKTDGIKAGFEALGKNDNVNKAMGLFANAFGGGQKSAQERAHETPIVSNLASSMASEDVARMGQAQQMMKSLLERRRNKARVPGLSLMG